MRGRLLMNIYLLTEPLAQTPPFHRYRLAATALFYFFVSLVLDIQRYYWLSVE